MRYIYLLGAATLALTPSAFAQTASAPSPAKSAQTADEEIVITAPFRQAEDDLLQGTSVVTGEALQRDLRPTIGETLARQPGVSATSFGPSASRPILRGFQGERIRVLTDGIGAIDVSNTSVDHAVVIDPLLAERVEVLRGPSALLFGSSAIGGVVNVIDTRIPRSVPEKGYRVNAIGTYGSAANERSIGGAADVALGGKFVLHADGSYTKTDDLKIPGYVLSGPARAQALATAAQPQPAPDPDAEEPIDFAANAALRGRLPNSASETWTAGVGASIITDTGSLGVSYSHYDSLYGIPVRYATELGQEQEAPRLDIAQDRFDLRGEVETGGGFLERIRARAGYASYRHFELEDTGEIATRFYNKGLEGRLELVQAEHDGWRGVSGVQYFNRRFDVQGEEAFLPKNRTGQFGVFTLQQIDLGQFRAEGGLRYERTQLTADTLVDDLRFFSGKRSFDAVSGSVGASLGVAPGVRIGLNLSRTERAPSGEELFANGAHAGTQAYELGNPDFKLEKSWGIEATVHANGDGFHFDASAYYNWFSNYIFESQVAQSVCQAAADPSGREVEFPCFQFQQADARYYGFEADASVRLARIGGYAVNLDLLGDYVHANVVDRGPVPRIPPLRLLGGLELQSDRLTARAEVEHVFEQDRIAAFETPTSDYTLVNASIAFRPWGKDSKTSILLSANNIFDVEARRHTSFLKDFAPLAGRDFRASLRIGF
ncbi:TonB-dependent receptor [Sphingomonas koreensis]|jgi:iron complex outermembrane receptor protein|uniref:TonB-dependent receptor n=1 Tax=Sphingomonas koreensis TaxID=93064 RepID=A0A1L6JB12_9SPHN|nr:TonB-dependent receptor [Sphingomonas koreensis]APR53112.1 TonB-dependent receptor [Sphingomonas koreensis]MDC7810207.1 TonB-dependent receptor [Sphingomonas koreensis]RSU24762.1 TonB-dependent receptor [Sphingomonas koreensis]RSU24932.1 TonB-dependent receptor [Sphingomonas koreensis]RSU26967.1 TonB-dependent receptor [Sphingomonas koreensis]